MYVLAVLHLENHQLVVKAADIGQIDKITLVAVIKIFTVELCQYHFKPHTGHSNRRVVRQIQQKIVPFLLHVEDLFKRNDLLLSLRLQMQTRPGRFFITASSSSSRTDFKSTGFSMYLRTPSR